MRIQRITPKTERCNWGPGFPLTRPSRSRGNTGPASPPVGRGRVAGWSGFRLAPWGRGRCRYLSAVACRWAKADRLWQWRRVRGVVNCIVPAQICHAERSEASVSFRKRSFDKLRMTAFGVLMGIVSHLASAQEPRPGLVQFSNGETVTGQLSLTPGAELKVVNGTTLSTLTLDKVQKIRLAPEEETLEQKWRFLVAGQTRKEKWGAPYPVRHLRATVVLGNGETMAGHLYTTVLYLEGPEKNQKIILEAKQRGQEGATFQSLVYPASVRFTDVAFAAESRIRLQTGLPGTIVALTRGALVRLEASGDQLPSPLGAELFVAVQTASNIMVGWPRSERGEPAETNDVITKAVRDALPDVRDFFDVRELHGVWREPITGDVYSLMLLERRGATTLNAERSQPWRCEVWRWKFADEDKKLLVAGRNYFFRGIVTRGEPAPAVTTSLPLWNLHKSGETWKAGDQ